MKVGRKIKDEQLRCVRELDCDPAWEAKDPDHVAYLAKETIDSGHSVLIFCASKRGCEDTAKHLNRLLDVQERFIGDREGRAQTISWGIYIISAGWILFTDLLCGVHQ